MGRVYRGRHVRLGREVALKVLNPDLAARRDVVERFFREARVVNDIDHEHIVEVTDFVEAPGLAYLVMELLEGRSLRELVKAPPEEYPALPRLVEILAQVCDALHAAHEKGVVHRDLKPDNVFVLDRRGGDFAKVLDFGVAKLRDPVDHAATSSGMILGTPSYMAPEQALGREVDRRADVWAAGVVLHELLAGALPFTGKSFIELAIRIREKPPAPLPDRTPRGEAVPPELAAVVARCLEKRPADRFDTMAELAQALRAPGAARARATGGGRARGGRVAILAIALGALLAGGAAAVRLGFVARARDAAAGALGDVVRRVDEATSPRGAAPPGPGTAPAERAQAARDGAAALRPDVEVLVRSTPPGAAVVRLDSDEPLGETPLRFRVPRRPGTLRLEMRLAGFEPVRFEVDLRRDTTANVAFERAPRRTTRGR
jgi:hypothetical protein